MIVVSIIAAAAVFVFGIAMIGFLLLRRTVVRGDH